MAESGRDRPPGGSEIATSTLAEIYAQQGLLARALEIYRRIARRNPSDARVAARIEDLERTLTVMEDAARPPAATAPPEPPLEAAASPPARPAAPPVTEDEAFRAWLERR